MPIIKITLLLLLSGLFLNGAGPAAVRAETDSRAFFYFRIDKSTYFDPDHLYLDIVVRPGSRSHNLLDLGINFDPAALGLLEAEVNDACAFIFYEYAGADNASWHLACGSDRVFDEEVPVARLKFAKLKAGWTAISFGRAAVFAADGSGHRTEADGEDHRLLLIK